MRRLRRQTKRERKRAEYEAALAQGMEDALTGPEAGLAYVDFETAALSSKMQNVQSLQRLDTLRYARQLLAEFEQSYPGEYQYFKSYKKDDLLFGTDVSENTQYIPKIADHLLNIDYASVEIRELERMRMSSGLGVYALASSLERLGHEPPQEEALCTEVPTLVLEEGQVGCGHGASSCWPDKGEGHKLRRACWFGSFSRALTAEQLRASADPGGTSSEARQVFAKVSEVLAPALKPYV